MTNKGERGTLVQDCYEQVTRQLALEVSRAERFRQTREHNEVESIYMYWTRRRVAQKARRSQERRGAPDGPTIDLLAVGIAGLARIEHVDYNARLSEKGADERPTPSPKFSEIGKIYQELGGVENLVPWTIHGDGIWWTGEVTQDWAVTYTLWGDKEAAERALISGMKRTVEVIDELKEQVDPQTNGGELKSQDYEGYMKRMKYIGAIGALGVMLGRQGKLTQNLDSIIYGLKHYSGVAFKHQPSAHRLATLAGWTINGAREYPASMTQRLTALFVGGMALVKAWSVNPLETKTAIKPMLNR